MTDNSKIDDAEKAYAAAALDVKAADKPAAPAKVEAKPAAPVKAEAKPVPPAKAEAKSVAPANTEAKPGAVAKVAEPAKAVRAKPAAKPAARAVKAKAAKAKPVKAKAAKADAPKKSPVRKPAVRAVRAPAKSVIKPNPVRRAPTAPVTPTPVSSYWKEAVMTTKTTDYTKPIADAFGEIQTRAKAAYDKSTVALTDATDFAKGNVEAIVESSKILTAGVQDLSRTYVEEAKSAYETVTGDVKELAAVKSPTELFQLQGKIARRNFDAMVSTSSKNTDAFLKLATDAFAPLTGRMNLAAEKLAKVA